MRDLMSRDGRDGIVNGRAVLPASEVQASAVEAEPSVLVISTVTEPGAVSGVLTGGDPDTFVSFSLAEGGEPEHGTVAVDPWGSYTYTPDPGFEGSDSFTFAVTSEDGETATATVAITLAVEAPLAITGSEGNDVLIGGTGDNVINGLGGFDRLVGGEGDDTLTLGSEGNATGGVGNDTLTGGSGYSDLSGGAGDDMLSLGEGGGFASGDAGDDTLSLGESGGFAFGDAGHDTLTGGAGSDFLAGGPGRDQITAGAGDDTVSLDDLDAGDFADGGKGSDFLYVNAGTATDPVVLTGSDGELFLDGVLIATGFESFGITAGSGNDTLTGSSGFNNFYGGAGDDTISLGEGGGAAFGDAGNDTLTGGSGNDVLLSGTGSDRITAGAGDDTLVLGEDGGVLGEDGGSAYGGAGHDTLSGGSGFERLRGGAGNDLLNTSDGGGRAWGGRGHDTLTGGSGNDMLVGGRGDDVLTGGAGTDEFRFTAGLLSGVETDLISDFEVGVDTLVLRNVSIASITAADLDGDGMEDASVLLSSGDVIGLIGVSGVTADDLI